jgi:hypothetical protein
VTDDLAQTILDLLKQHDHDQALNLASRSLRDEPDDERANYLAAECFLATHRPGLALPYALRAIALAPEQPATWNHAGRCYDQLLRWEEAEQAFQRAMLLDPKTVTYVANMSTIRVNAGRHAEALEWCERTLAMESDNRQAICNRGMARLALGDRAGWDDWEHGVSFQPGRTERFYGDAGRWQGKDGETVVFYSEQGLGDEIALAAYLAPCLARTTGYVDVEPRLVNLFKRSFPQAAGIHGTRLQMAEWLGDQEVDRRCIFGSMPRYCEPYDGAPYLVADPARRLQWRALLDSLGPGLKVGLAWTGGIQETRAAMRSLEVGMLKPLLATQGAHFVSLEYRDRHDAEARAAGIHVWPWGTRTNDYDDTAALVAELDLVVAVPTTVTHLAGALGVPCLVLVQDAPAWPFGVEGDRMSAVLRFESVRLLRKRGREWPAVIREAARWLRQRVETRDAA